jgi:hypothetical protein
MINFFKYKLTEQEQQLIDLVDSMLGHPATEVKLTPLSKKNFIVNEVLHYYILIKDSGMQIVNTKFTIIKNLREKTYDIIMNKIYQYVEDDRQKVEDMMFYNETCMLNEVKNKLEFVNA